jgi:hypothetical protein
MRAQELVSYLKGKWWSRLVVLSPWVLGIVFGITTSWKNSARAEHQQTTQAIIVTRTMNHGNFYHYKYVVRGSTYEGSDNAEPLIAPGQSITVFYDATNPGRSSLLDFADRAKNDAAPVPLVLLMSAFSVYVIYLIYRPRPPSQHLP